MEILNLFVDVVLVARRWGQQKKDTLVYTSYMIQKMNLRHAAHLLHRHMMAWGAFSFWGGVFHSLSALLLCSCLATAVLLLHVCSSSYSLHYSLLLHCCGTLLTLFAGLLWAELTVPGGYYMSTPGPTAFLYYSVPGFSEPLTLRGREGRAKDYR